MLGSKLTAALAAVVVTVAFGGLAVAVEPAQIIKDRQATMKRQGGDMQKIKAYLDGKGELAAAQQSATDLTQTTGKIPGLFPQGTDQASPDGKYRPKPAVWTDWNGFLAAQKTANDKADALAAAATGGDKAKIQTAFGDLGKNGCGGCHEKFREKLQ